MKTLSIKKLESQIKELEVYLQKHSNGTNHFEVDALNKIKEDLQNRTYKIAIVANMSAGKSTFINALFGKEILPSSTGATTDCATYIYSSREDDTEKKAIVHFKDGRPPRHLSQDKLDELKHYAKKDSDTEEKYHNAQTIELYYPFAYIPKKESPQQDDLKVFFIDTPGPNNQGQGAEKHSEQTRNAIKGAHVALFLFDFTQIPATYGKDGNPNDLWSIIKQHKDDNPHFKVFFIVNKFDEFLRDASRESKPWDAVEKKKEDIRKELKETAEEKGIKDAEVFFTAARPALADRMDTYSRDCTRFKEDFKEVYQESGKRDADQALKDFMGIDIMEDKINDYLNNEASRHFLEIHEDKIREFLEEKRNNLNRTISTLSQPKETAKTHIKEAKEILKNLKAEKKSLADKLEEIKENTLGTIREILKKQQKEIKNQIDEIIGDTILFLDFYAHDEKKSFQEIAQRVSNLTPQGRTNSLNETKNRETIKAANQDRADSTPQATKEYANFRFNQAYTQSHQNLSKSIEDIYSEHQSSYRQAIREFKSNLKSKINKALDINEEALALPEKITPPNNLKVNIALESIDFQLRREWHDWAVAIPTFGIYGKEKHITPIDYDAIQRKSRESIQQALEKLKSTELNKHEKNLQNEDETFWQVIEKHISMQNANMANLEKELEDAVTNLKKAQKAQQEFEELSAYKYYKNQGAKS